MKKTILILILGTFLIATLAFAKCLVIYDRASGEILNEMAIDTLKEKDLEKKLKEFKNETADTAILDLGSIRTSLNQTPIPIPDNATYLPLYQEDK